MKRLDAPKIATPMRNQRRRPKMSPRRPPVTSRTAKVSVYALTVHSRFAVETPRSRCMEGSVASTIRLSSVIMKSAAPVKATAQMRVRRVVTRSSVRYDIHRT